MDEQVRRHYRKKPVVIEAVRLSESNLTEVARWTHAISASLGGLYLATLEGTMIAAIGDWIVCGVQGEFYPVKAEIFHQTYELVED